MSPWSPGTVSGEGRGIVLTEEGESLARDIATGFAAIHRGVEALTGTDTRRHAVNLARERGVALKPGLVERFRGCYDAITAEGIAFHEAQPPLAPKSSKAKRRGSKPRRTGHNLLRRLQTHKEDALRFLINFAVPFTNNQAEQDGRMMKVKQKISGGFPFRSRCRPPSPCDGSCPGSSISSSATPRSP